MTVAPSSTKTVLLTGATGYIGGRLAPRLLQEGAGVRCLVRDRRKLLARRWSSHPNVQIAEWDLGSGDLGAALRGCDVAYYLVHSMIASGSRYRAVDRDLAQRFAAAAREAGVRRIIYLGGLGEMGEGLSPHLASRREVEEGLASSGVPVTVLRAAMIIGAGSASFEILRYLVERLPVMITPRWVSTECQPIAVGDVLHALLAARRCPEAAGRTLDIGGAEVMTYRQIMATMAEVLGLPRRLIIPVPLLTPRLSSWWIDLVTPISHRIARPLAEGLRNRVVCRDQEGRRLLPAAVLTVRESIEAAVRDVASDRVPTAWFDAGVIPGDPDWAGGAVFEDRRCRRIQAAAGSVFAAVIRVGGGRGYYAADWLWRLRGMLDRLAGGPGLRRGRRERESLAYGDALDFWRVTAVEPDRSLRLRAEMKLPGTAELSFRIEPDGDGACTLIQTARFKPRGLLGLLYWHAVAPLHAVVFRGMLRGIERQAVGVA
jgi:uncharacterized protein YbjT (DUF2867 family)